MLRPIAFLVFFASGFAALLYQVVWQRLLVFFSGADVYSVTIIVAAFMAGLGAGSLVGGHLADRSSRRTSLAMFVGAEFAIALFGLFSKEFFYDFLYQNHRELGQSGVLLSAVLLLSLLWPTFFMGVSLPLLAKALTPDIGQAAPIIGRLYGINTLGAAVGSIITTWALLPRLGLERSLLVGATLNFACAAAGIFLVLARKQLSQNPAPIRPIAETEGSSPRPSLAPIAPSEPVGQFGFGTWVLLYGLSGFIALSLEILWFRLLGVMLKSTAFTFGTLLAIYLGGLSLGALAGTIFVKRSRRPMIVFLALQSLVGLCAGLTVAVFVSLLVSSRFPHLFAYFGARESIDVPAAFRGIHDWLNGQPGSAGDQIQWLGTLYVALPVVLVGPTTVLMGLSFPYLQKAVQIDAARIGRRVGTLQVSNIVGGMAGTILTGLTCLSLFGTALTLKLVVGGAGIFAALWWWNAFPRLRRIAIVPGIALPALMLVALPNAETLWATLHGTYPARIVFQEDGSGVSLMRSDQDDLTHRVDVFVNGVSQSWVPYGGVHSALGALPVLIHPNPRDVAVIGLGSGDTVFSMGGRSETQNIACIEIVRPQLETLRRLSGLNPYFGLGMLLGDSRIRHIAGDGRAFVMRSNTRYDVIEADALRPTSAYAGNLYSREYFELLRDHLKPGGFAVTWAPTPRVRQTFLRVFPYVLRFNDIAIGSLEPIQLNLLALYSRVKDPLVRDYYARAGINIESLVGRYAQPGGATQYGPEDERTDPSTLNTDLFPRDEFDLPPLFGP
jgi:spermidine synthase